MKNLAPFALGVGVSIAGLLSTNSASATPRYITRSGTAWQGQSASPLANTSREFCYLSAVGGRFKGVRSRLG